MSKIMAISLPDAVFDRLRNVEKCLGISVNRQILNALDTQQEVDCAEVVKRS